MTSAEYIIPGTTIHGLLEEIVSLADESADAEIGPDGRYQPNTAMDISVKAEQAIELLKRVERDFKVIRAYLNDQARTLEHACLCADATADTNPEGA